MPGGSVTAHTLLPPPGPSCALTTQLPREGKWGPRSRWAPPPASKPHRPHCPCGFQNQTVQNKPQGFPLRLEATTQAAVAGSAVAKAPSMPLTTCH